MSNFSEYGPALVKHGHHILPIAQGEKYPKNVPGWQNYSNDKAVLSNWNKLFPDAGVGVRCDITPAIDIDVYDKKISQKLADWLRERLDGDIIERVGEAPKILFPCRTEKPLRKINSCAYQDVFGATNKIEILGQGQFFVAYHVHPDTNKEYYYTSQKTLAEVKPADLPLIDEQLIKELFEYFESIAPEGWVKKEQGTKSSQSGDDPLMSAAPRLEISEEEITDLLTSLPNDDFSYDRYLQVGMALHHQFSGMEEGFKIWSEWCAKSDKNDDNTNRFKWRSFGKNTSLHPVTFASILKLSQEFEVKEKKKVILGEDDDDVPDEADDLQGFRTRYAYVPEENKVLDLQRPLEYALIKMEAFKNLTAPKRTEVKAPTQADPDKTKLVPTSSLWLIDKDRMTVEGTTYRPDSDKRIVRSEDRRMLVNMAHFPDHKKHFDNLCSDEDAWRLNVFNNHMRYLLPIKEQRRWFIQWLAFNVQHPEKRCKVTPLHVSRPHGTGRGWVVNLIEALLGTWNVSKTTISEMCGEGSAGQFQDYLYRTLVCCVEEVKATDKRYSVSDSLRDKMTEDRLNVNLKFGGKATINVHTCFFWMSNHADGIVLPEQDRRTHVLEGPDYVQPGEYYDELYAWLDSPENLAFLWLELSQMDLTSFEWKVAPKTRARERMIEYAQTSTEDVFKTWLSENKNEWMLQEDIQYQLGVVAERDGVTELLSLSQIRKLLQQYCYQRPQMRLGDGTDRKVRPWYLGVDREPEHSLDHIRETLLSQQGDE